MFPLFETICIKEGVVQNMEWHQKRYDRSFEAFYAKKPLLQLSNHIEVPSKFTKGMVKLRLRYNDSTISSEYERYHTRTRKSLKIVKADDLDYSLKYSDRIQFKKLFELRGDCDDILIIKNGMVSDTSYANIVFQQGENWYTPTTPLLEGTSRARLLAEKKIELAEISLGDLYKYEGFALINAMNDLNIERVISTKHVIY